MLRELGFGQVSSDTVWAVLLCLLVLAVVAGWIGDAVLKGVGFGLFGNMFLAFAGAVAMLVVLVRWGWHWLQPDLMTMTSACVAGAFLAILLSSVGRRLTR